MEDDPDGPSPDDPRPPGPGHDRRPGHHPGKPRPTNNPESPAVESGIADNGGPGDAGIRKGRGGAEAGGKPPDRERPQAILGLARDLPPKHRELTETYFRKLAQTELVPGR